MTAKRPDNVLRGCVYVDAAIEMAAEVEQAVEAWQERRDEARGALHAEMHRIIGLMNEADARAVIRTDAADAWEHARDVAAARIVRNEILPAVARERFEALGREVDAVTRGYPKDQQAAHEIRAGATEVLARLSSVFSCNFGANPQQLLGQPAAHLPKLEPDFPDEVALWRRLTAAAAAAAHFPHQQTAADMRQLLSEDWRRTDALSKAARLS